MQHKTVPVGNAEVEVFLIELQSKNLILFRGSKGFVMCGYLDLAAAEKFSDVACRITGVSSIEEALGAAVQSCTSAAAAMGISGGMPVKEVLKIIV